MPSRLSKKDRKQKETHKHQQTPLASHPAVSNQVISCFFFLRVNTFVKILLRTDTAKKIPFQAAFKSFRALSRGAAAKSFVAALKISSAVSAALSQVERQHIPL